MPLSFSAFDDRLEVSIRDNVFDEDGFDVVRDDEVHQLVDVGNRGFRFGSDPLGSHNFDSISSELFALAS